MILRAVFCTVLRVWRETDTQTERDKLERAVIMENTEKKDIFDRIMGWGFLKIFEPFYKKNKEWLDPWIAKIQHLENSHLKLEWNCGDDAKPILEDKIIQFRASGIRVKLPTFSPALNLVGTQIPIFLWVDLPTGSYEPGEPSKGRYMTRKEAAKLQGMMKLKFGDERFQLSVKQKTLGMENLRLRLFSLIKMGKL